MHRYSRSHCCCLQQRLTCEVCASGADEYLACMVVRCSISISSNGRDVHSILTSSSPASRGPSAILPSYSLDSTGIAPTCNAACAASGMSGCMRSRSPLAVCAVLYVTAVCASLALQAFWVPSQAPEAKDLLAKPDSATYCPASSKKLRLKDCVAVKFTPVRQGM